MQSKKIKRYESREFSEIMANLSPVEQSYIRDKIKTTLKVSRSTLWHWENGKHAPTNASRYAIADILDKCLNIKTKTDTLFR